MRVIFTGFRAAYRPRTRRGRETVLACLVLAAASPAIAATSTWTGASSVTWATTGNWNNGVPGTGDTAVFGAAAANDLNIDIGSGVTLNTIRFSSAVSGTHSITAGSGFITINDGGAIVYDRIASGNFDQTISRPIVLSGSAMLTNNNTLGNLLVISGSLSGSGVITVTGSGPSPNNGEVRLSANNPGFAGSWNVQGGYLNAQTAGSLGPAASVTIAGSSIVQLGTGTNPVTVNSSNAFVRWNGIATWGGTYSVASGVTGKLSTGNNAVTWTGAIVGDSTANFLTGGGTVLTFGGSTSNTLSGTYTLSWSTNNNSFVLDKSAGATAINGTLVVSATGNALNFVRWNQSNQIADTSVVVLSPFTSSTSALRLFGQTDTIGGLTSGGAGTSVVENERNATNGMLTLNVASGTSYTFAGIIRNGTSATPGVLAIGMAGSGTQVLSGSNTFTGGATIQGGVLRIGHSNALGTGTATLSGGTLDLGGLSTATNAIVLTGGTLTNGTVAVTQISATSGQISANLTGSGGLSKLGAGTLALSGSNDFSGATVVSGGTLSLLTASAIPATSAVTLSAGVLDISAISTSSATLASLSGSSGALVALGAKNLTVDNSAVATYAGEIAGTGGLTKQGAGTLLLAGANTYSGPTAVNAGTLTVNGSLASTSLNVAAGATLMGSGSIAGNTTILGTHLPGNSPGIETFGSNLTYSGGGSSVTWELWGNTATQGSPTAIYDQIVVGGDLDFAAATTLNLLFSSGGSVNWNDTFWDTNHQWVIYDVAGTTVNVGNLMLVQTNWADASSNLFQTARGQSSFSLSQSGSDVVLVYAAVPEPGTLTLAGIGAALAGWVVVRRRSARRLI